VLPPVENAGSDFWTPEPRMLPGSREVAVELQSISKWIDPASMSLRSDCRALLQQEVQDLFEESAALLLAGLLDDAERHQDVLHV